MNKLLASSSDPKQLSLTVKGFLMLLAPIAAMIIKYGGNEISNTDLEQVINSISDIVFFLGSTAALITTLWGVLRKVFNSLK